jgi:carotenoid cleavage dioxygenase
MVNTVPVEANPYLEGIYAPVEAAWTGDGLAVEGTLPPDLRGIFVRNGPNPRYQPSGRYHWFDGDGMLHALRFADGQASYRSRWVRTRAFDRETEVGHPLWTGIMENPKANPADMPLKDTANTDVITFGDRLLALWYLSGEPYAVDPRTLETRGLETFGGTLPCRMSAHAKVDTATGELFFFDYGPRPPYLRYGVVGPTNPSPSASGHRDGPPGAIPVPKGERVEHLVDIDLPGPRLPHDMAITERHAILMDLPLVNDAEAMREGRHKIVFDRDLPARFAVIPRRGHADDVRWFTASPCYIYHSVNAWEAGDEVVLDVCRVNRPQPRADAVGPLAKLLSYLRLDAQLFRYRFNLRTGATHEQQLDDENTEFPAINMARLGRPSRFAYNVRISPAPTLLFDGIVKYDTEKATSDTHAFGPGRAGSEVAFAPRPGAVAEDDGYLVSFVHDDARGSSEVVVLDATDVAAGPIARVLLPVRVPLGFHACWVNA